MLRSVFVFCCHVELLVHIILSQAEKCNENYPFLSMAYSIRLSHILNCNKVQRGLRRGWYGAAFYDISRADAKGAFACGAFN